MGGCIKVIQSNNSLSIPFTYKLTILFTIMHQAGSIGKLLRINIQNLAIESCKLLIFNID